MERPICSPAFTKKIDKLKDKTDKKPIKTWSRNSTIIPDFVGHSFMIHNWKLYTYNNLRRNVGHKLGEFAPTRTFKGQQLQIKKQLHQQQQNQQEIKIMEKNNSLIRAINKNVRTSPRKLALVCNFIKGKSWRRVKRFRIFEKKNS